MRIFYINCRSWEHSFRLVRKCKGQDVASEVMANNLGYAMIDWYIYIYIYIYRCIWLVHFSDEAVVTWIILFELTTTRQLHWRHKWARCCLKSPASWSFAHSFHVTDLCEGHLPVTGEFPSQRASNEENVSIWWRDHDLLSGPIITRATSQYKDSLIYVWWFPC